MDEKKAAALELVKILEKNTGVTLAWTDTKTLYEALVRSGFHYNKKQRVWKRIYSPATFTQK